TVLLVASGTISLLGMQAVTYLRNWINFKNPLWPMIQYDNDRLGIHWKGALAVDPGPARAGINFNQPFSLFSEKMPRRPYTATGTHHTWQIDDWGFAMSWVVLPLAALAIVVLTLRWCSGWLATLLNSRRGPTPRSDEHEETLVAGAMILAIVGGVSLYLSP